MKRLIDKILNQETITDKEYIQAHLYLRKLLCSSKRQLGIDLASQLNFYEKENIIITIGGVEYIYKQ